MLGRCSGGVGWGGGVFRLLPILSVVGLVRVSLFGGGVFCVWCGIVFVGGGVASRFLLSG